MCPVCRMLAGLPASIPQTGHITLSPAPDQQLENHNTKYHRQRPLYNNLELLMMGIVVPETCWASNKICNKNFCCIYLAFYFHILTTMRGQNHIKFVIFKFSVTLLCCLSNSIACKIPSLPVFPHINFTHQWSVHLTLLSSRHSVSTHLKKLNNTDFGCLLLAYNS